MGSSFSLFCHYRPRSALTNSDKCIASGCVQCRRAVPTTWSTAIAAGSCGTLHVREPTRLEQHIEARARLNCTPRVLSMGRCLLSWICTICVYQLIGQCTSCLVIAEARRAPDLPKATHRSDAAAHDAPSQASNRSCPCHTSPRGRRRIPHRGTGPSRHRVAMLMQQNGAGDLGPHFGSSAIRHAAAIPSRKDARISPKFHCTNKRVKRKIFISSSRCLAAACVWRQTRS